MVKVCAVYVRYKLYRYNNTMNYNELYAYNINQCCAEFNVVYMFKNILSRMI